MSNDIYQQQVQLLIRVLPVVFKETCFALKGGTAINLFVREMPRLSVDIDLVYLPNEGRDSALPHIKEALTRISKNLCRVFSGMTVQNAFDNNADALRLIVTLGAVRIKIELSPVLRGTVHPPVLRDVCATVEASFGYAHVPVVSIEDLYGGKICAALDRQHPRDLFDIRQLIAAEGITDSIRKTTLVYIISHPRPISELLAPHLKDISVIYTNEFTGMTRDKVTLEELLETRLLLVSTLKNTISEDERAFLISFKAGEPQWNLLGLPGIELLPAVKWKIQNVARMDQAKHVEALDILKRVLFTG